MMMMASAVGGTLRPAAVESSSSALPSRIARGVKDYLVIPPQPFKEVSCLLSARRGQCGFRDVANSPVFRQ